MRSGPGPPVSLSAPPPPQSVSPAALLERRLSPPGVPTYTFACATEAVDRRVPAAQTAMRVERARLMARAADGAARGVTHSIIGQCSPKWIAVNGKSARAHTRWTAV